MRGTIGQLQERLAAAGVGHRPVIFVCHRCDRLDLQLVRSAILVYTAACPGPPFCIALKRARCCFDPPN